MPRLSGVIRGYATAVVLGTMLFLPVADAQAAIPRVGVLSIPPIEQLLRVSLRERGYIEGQNILIESRSYANDQELRSGAADLVRSKVDLIVTFGTPAAQAVLAATATIPVVFSSGDPVGTGLVASLVKPVGNATGVSAVSTELIAKRLDFLHQLAPRARRIAYLMNSSNPLGTLQLKEARRTAAMLGVQLIVLDSRNVAELDKALNTLRKRSVDALLVTADFLFELEKSTIARAVRSAKLPTMSPYKEYLEDGVLSSYGPDLKELANRMAVYADKILKGAKPSDLPIEQISKYELVIDLRTARALRIKVPQELVYRADQVIR